MSRRTAESNKAIALAWEKEKERIKDGKGTRNWTKEQQKDILERGKAYDESGRAFEGQHMRSADAYPESQGDSENIQFLTREEHLAAHDGKWTNATNWYYDPISKEKVNFGDGPIIPCKVIELSEPLFEVKKNDETKPKDSEVTREIISEKRLKGTDYNCKETKKDLNENCKNALAANMMSTTSVENLHITSVKNQSIFMETMKCIGKNVLEYIIEHPTEVISIAGALVVGVQRKRNSNNQANNEDKSSLKIKQPTTSSKCQSAIKPESVVSDGESIIESHASPTEHTVSGHWQHYGKDKVLKEKKPYKRGHKKSENNIV